MNNDDQKPPRSGFVELLIAIFWLGVIFFAGVVLFVGYAVATCGAH